MPMACADTFDVVRSCQATMVPAHVRVAFEDSVVARDNTRSLEELKNLSQSSAGPYHQVQGLTHAQARTRYAVRSATLSHADGRVCAMLSLDVTISLTGLTVYLARGLGNQGCKRAIVDAHEQEHVAVWRNHLRIGARLLEPLLRERLKEPLVFASAQEMKDGLRGRVDAVLNPLLQQLQDGIVAANRQIDSPQSYQSTAQRLLACP